MYRILVIDDDIDNRAPVYRAAFEIPGLTSVHMPQRREQALTQVSDGQRWHAYLVDIFLSRWHMDASAFVAEHQLGARGVVCLVSRFWTLTTEVSDSARSEATHDLVEVLRSCKLGQNPITDLIDFKRLEVNPRKGNESRRARAALINALDQRNLQESRFEDLNKPIRLLHLSDPQFGDSQDAGDSQPEFHIRKEILEPKGIEIDLVAVTGDLAFSGREYDDAEKWLTERVATQLLGDRTDWKSRVHLVAGNHDADFRADIGGFFDADLKWFQKWSGKETEIGADAIEWHNEERGHLIGSNKVRFMEFQKRCLGVDRGLNWVEHRFAAWGLQLVGLDTAASIGIQNLEEAHVEEQTRARVLRELEQEGFENQFRLLLTHHPASDIAEDDAVIWDRRSQRDFMEWLASAQIDLWIAGHTHEQGRTHLGSRSGVEGLVCTTAGTLYTRRLRANARYGFQLLTMERRDGRIVRVSANVYELPGMSTIRDRSKIRTTIEDFTLWELKD